MIRDAAYAILRGITYGLIVLVLIFLIWFTIGAVSLAWADAKWLSAPAPAAPPSPYLPEMACGGADAVAESLRQKYGERRVGAGMRSPLEVIEFWVSSDAASWTLVSYRANGARCVIAAGDFGMVLRPAPAGVDF